MQGQTGKGVTSTKKSCSLRQQFGRFPANPATCNSAFLDPAGKCQRKHAVVLKNSELCVAYIWFHASFDDKIISLVSLWEVQEFNKQEGGWCSAYWHLNSSHRSYLAQAYRKYLQNFGACAPQILIAASTIKHCVPGTFHTVMQGHEVFFEELNGDTRNHEVWRVTHGDSGMIGPALISAPPLCRSIYICDLSLAPSPCMKAPHLLDSWVRRAARQKSSLAVRRGYTIQLALTKKNESGPKTVVNSAMLQMHASTLKKIGLPWAEISWCKHISSGLKLFSSWSWKISQFKNSSAQRQVLCSADVSPNGHKIGQTKSGGSKIFL